jgi:hypothetical protein
MKRSTLNDNATLPRVPANPGAPHPFDFFDLLQWLDGRPLMDTIEPYRRRIFEDALYSFGADGFPRYNRVLCGRAKKNWKSADLILAALYRLLVWPSGAGNDCFCLANDEEQAGDDLSLAKKLVAINPVLNREVDIRAKEIVRKDGRGTLKILPAKDVAGAHGKTFLFLGYDEIHGFKNFDLLEALSPDPTRRDVLTWITSYAGISHAPGIPLYDFMQTGKSGSDPRMLFSWYAADFTTDSDFQGDDLSPEDRANPSMASWGNSVYLLDQKQRLPSNKYRRLHLNLPGAPDGAAFSGEHVMAAIVPGRRSLAPAGQRYFAFVDMSGGSNDDACLAIAHKDKASSRVILDLLVSQSGRAPFDPRRAVSKFAALCKTYHVSRVIGDAFPGETYRFDFADHGISYQVASLRKSDIYEDLEPRLNAGEVELLDIPQLQEQLLTLVWRGNRIDHQNGDHDDWANAAAGAVWAVARKRVVQIDDAFLANSKVPEYYKRFSPTYL